MNKMKKFTIGILDILPDNFVLFEKIGNDFEVVSSRTTFIRRQKSDFGKCWFELSSYEGSLKNNIEFCEFTIEYDLKDFRWMSKEDFSKNLKMMED